MPRGDGARRDIAALRTVPDRAPPLRPLCCRSARKHMGSNSFSLFSSAKSTLQMLRARVQQTPDAAVELHAAIDLIQALWEELQAQSELLSAERQRHAEFFEYAPDAYVITEPKGEIREANRASRELFGVKNDDVDGVS